MRFVDFFAGIGGIRAGLERAGFECIGFCEFDKFAQKAYRAMFDTEGEWFSSDIRTVSSADVPRADLWTFGFPCQDLSAAGKRKGIQEGERSGLFYEIVRLLRGLREEDRPKWLLAENVKGLFSSGRGFDFLRCIVELGECGYDLQWQLLNTKDFGVPQNRERVFVVGHLRDGSRREVFPLARTDGENPVELRQIGRYDRTKTDNPMAYRVYDRNGLSPTLTTVTGGGMVPLIVDKNGRMRRVTPRETWRLQGFPEEYIDNAFGLGLSDAKLYKMAGNAVSVPVAKAIGEAIMRAEEET